MAKTLQELTENKRILLVGNSVEILQYNLKDKIRFESTIIRHGERNARLGWAQLDLAPYWDGRMSIVYTYNDQLNATFRIDNIFNSRVDWWTGYTAQGIRANLGLVYKF